MSDEASTCGSMHAVIDLLGAAIARDSHERRRLEAKVERLRVEATILLAMVDGDEQVIDIPALRYQARLVREAVHALSIREAP